MPRYTFTFKKDDVFVEFTTEDKDTVERQFQIWVADADDYARYGRTRSKAEKQIEEPKEEFQPQESSPVAVTPEAPVENVEANSEPEPEKAPSEPEPQEQPAPEAFDKASTLLKTINTIQQEQDQGQSLSFDIEEKPAAPSADFESVLDKTIENPTFEPDKTKDQVFLNLVKSKNTTDKFHYLIITAYFLSEFEKLERFSLKQINAKLMQNLSEIIDSATLQAALSQHLIEMVPDYTGVSDVAEYKLTSEGEEFFANGIG